MTRIIVDTEPILPQIPRHPTRHNQKAHITPVYRFLAFSNSDLGRQPFSIAPSTFTVSGTPAVMNILDDDPIFDDEALGSGQTVDASHQILDQPFDGIYGAGLVAQSVYRYTLTNNTTGQVGTAYLLRIYAGTNPSAPGGQNGEYYNSFTIPSFTIPSFTTPVNIGDNITLPAGNFVGQTTYRNLVICYTPGTQIAPPHGARDVQTLRPGDLITTRDNGPQPLAWIGTRNVAARNALAPIEIAAGVLDNTAPLRVSPNHRMLITAASNDLYFGTTEVFVAAKHLLGQNGVRRVLGGQVTYIHLLFDRHQVVYANNAPSESLFPGAAALAAMDRAARAEVLHLFPELAAKTAHNFAQTARLCLNRAETTLLQHAAAL
ncbi:Hint domain-containing protein [Pseudorhodobacter antarcticus]|uniref:Hint domain-containing protein n=1 Tax=Pseudorhodobacter antarcticus TaxID=1077947 RepID=A0A1H8D7F6_9RHOB|nr:Hint domain-containing protein [Pseudorhodobacter antarcticus]SEN03253.1 Hint domain-containing protein [Pseudorhodobacter antarcticus]